MREFLSIMEYGPEFPKSSLSAFVSWWGGLSRIDRPGSYQVARNRLRNEKYSIMEFRPQFTKRTLSFRHGTGGRGPKIKREYWCGLKPDGSWYILGLSVMPELEARCDYVRKLCYWGRMPTAEEDEVAQQSIPQIDIFDTADRPVSLNHPMRLGKASFTTLGQKLGVF